MSAYGRTEYAGRIDEKYVGKKVVIDKEGGNKRHVYNTVIVKHRYYCYTGKYLRVYIPDT